MTDARYCEGATTKSLGVELTMGHAHGVDSGISTEKCRKVKQRFADRPVTLISLDRNQDLQHIGEKVLKASIERAKEFIKLGHASDGTSAKANPNDLPQ